MKDDRVPDPPPGREHASAPGSLGARDIFKISSRFSATNLATGAFSALSYLLIAKELGPLGMGLVGLSQLWLLYASFTRSGIMSAASREIMHSLGQGDTGEARRLEATALLGETSFLALTVAAMAAIAALWPLDPVLRRVLVITTVSFLCNSLLQFIDNLAWAHQRFSLITRANLISKASQPAFMLAGLYTAGLDGVLLGPALASLTTLAFYLACGPRINAGLDFKRGEMRRLLGIGIPLSLLGALYWGFRTSDRMLVARFLSVSDMGHFSFAMLFIGQGCQWISDFLNVLQSRLFTELGRTGRVRPLAPAIQRIGLMILAVTCAGAGLAQAAFGPLVSLAAPKFIAGIPAFNILSLNLIAICLPLLSNTILVSSVVNKQSQLALLQAGGLAVNAALGWWLSAHGYGLEGIAWSSVAAQLLVAFGAQGLLHRQVFAGAPKAEPLRFYASQLGLLAVALAQFLVLAGLPLEGAGTLLARPALLAVVWVPIAALLYRFGPGRRGAATGNLV